MPPHGRLTADDLIIHTFHGVAEEVPLGTVPYWRHPVDILRWSQPGRSEKRTHPANRPQ